MLFFLTEGSLNLPSKYQISCLQFDQTLQNFVCLREEIKEVKLGGNSFYTIWTVENISEKVKQFIQTLIQQIISEHILYES